MDIDSEEIKYDATISNDDDIETVEKKQNENEKQKEKSLCEGGTKWVVIFNIGILSFGLFHFVQKKYNSSIDMK